MSGSYTNTSGGSDDYNAGAAHDSGFYDPDRHDNQIVAVFEDEQAARAAQSALVQAGVPQNQVEVVGHVAGDAAAGVSQAEDKAIGDQILSAFTNLFKSSDDSDYTHAVNQGHAMVVVRPSGDTDRHRVIQVLEQSHPIDFDAKLAEWRQAGYDQSGAARSNEHGSAQREPAAHGASNRVRSYVSERDNARTDPTGPNTTGLGTTGPNTTGPGTMGTGGTVTNATPGATSSGTNSPQT